MAIMLMQYSKIYVPNELLMLQNTGVKHRYNIVNLSVCEIVNPTCIPLIDPMLAFDPNLFIIKPSPLSLNYLEMTSL